MSGNDSTLGFRDTSLGSTRSSGLGGFKEEEKKKKERVYGYWQTKEGWDDWYSRIDTVVATIIEDESPEFEHIHSLRDLIAHNQAKIWIRNERLEELLGEKYTEMRQPLAYNFGDRSSEAVINYIQHHENDRIREGYSKVKHHHFGVELSTKGINNYWTGPLGKQRGLAIMVELFDFLLPRHENLTALIRSFTRAYCKIPMEVPTPDGPIMYTAHGAYESPFESSISGAVLYTLNNHPDREIREGYCNIRPHHLNICPNDYWKGRGGVQNAVMVIDEKVANIMEDTGLTRNEVINLLTPEMLKEPIRVSTRDGDFFYSKWEGIADAFGHKGVMKGLVKAVDAYKFFRWKYA